MAIREVNLAKKAAERLNNSCSESTFKRKLKPVDNIEPTPVSVVLKRRREVVKEKKRCMKIAQESTKGVVKSKITKAIVETNRASKNVETLLQSMSDRDRQIFVSLISGEDELMAILKAGHKHGISTIAKIVYTKEGKPFETKRLNAKNVLDLDEMSYERLLRIAQCEVKNLTGKTDYKPFLTDITDLFRIIAPESLAVLAKIAASDKAKDTDRIKAANSILDRAGYEGSEMSKKQKDPMPVNVNILVGATPRAEDNPIIQVQE